MVAFRAGDGWGGLAAMLVALPSAIAFGVLVFVSIDPALGGQGALFGMLGAAALGLVAPLVGGTAGLISAPCAPAAAVLSGLAVALASSGVSASRIPLLLALTMLLAGTLQMLYGLLRGGRFIKYIPYPVVSGYMSGVGLIIALGQLPKLLGLPKGASLLHGFADPQLWQWPSIAVGLVTIAVMVFAPRLTRAVPAAILGLAAGIAAYFVIGAFVPALRSVVDNELVIGPVQVSGSFGAVLKAQYAGLLTLGLGDVQGVVYAALTLSALLSIDTLKTCVLLDATTGNRHHSNRELFGQGVANLCAAIGGGMAGAGTSGPTLVNVSSGGVTRWSGFAAGVFVVLVIVVLSGPIAWVPIGALAGILLVVAFRMFDWSAFHLLQHRETRLDFAVIATVVAIAETIGLIQASAAGVGLAILLFIRDQIRVSVLRRHGTLRELSSKTNRLSGERELLNAHGDMAAVLDLQGNLFFGTTDQLYTEVEADLRERRWVLVDMRRVQSLDYTGANLFKQMHNRLAKRDGGLLFCGMPSSLPHRQDIDRYLARIGLVGPRVFDTRDEGLEWMEDAILNAMGWHASATPRPLEVGEIEMLADLDADALDELRGCMIQRTLRAGDILFHRGDTGDELFLVRSGAVRILLPLPGGKRHHLATFGRGDFFGEMAFLDREPRSADAEAKDDCELFALSRQEFDAHVHGNPLLAARVFVRLARAESARLRQANIELRTLEDR